MRVVTRGNLDGLACAVLLSESEPVEEIVLVHPQLITDRKFQIQEGDIIAKLPYQWGCGKWFDHHASTRTYKEPPSEFEGHYDLAPSCARLVYDYYLPKNEGLQRFAELIDATDRFDSAQLNLEDVTHPEGYILLGFILDPRSGLEGDEVFFRQMVSRVRESSLSEIMALAEVKERAQRIAEYRETFLRAMSSCSRQEGNLIISDLRELDKVPPGNRFLVYTLFPEANVSLTLSWGPKKRFVVARAGHSIFNRTCPVHLGELMAAYGGGGHRGAAATPIPTEFSDRMISELTLALQASDFSDSDQTLDDDAETLV